MKYLFIGTFNPIWRVKRGEDPDYFYNRGGSLFWCILQHAFNEHCLIDRDRSVKEGFCTKFKIGLTDLIYCIDNVDETNEEHKKVLTSGFNDKNFQKIDSGGGKPVITYYTGKIKKYIHDN